MISQENFENTTLDSVKSVKWSLADSPLSFESYLLGKLGFVRGAAFMRGWNVDNLINSLEDELTEVRKKIR